MTMTLIDLQYPNGRLRRIAELLPDRPPVLAYFATLLADRLGTEPKTAVGIVLTMKLLLYDLECGISGFSGLPMPMGGHSRQDYFLIEPRLSQLLAVTFEPHDAEELTRGMQR